MKKIIVLLVVAALVSAFGFELMAEETKQTVKPSITKEEPSKPADKPLSPEEQIKKLTADLQKAQADKDLVANDLVNTRLMLQKTFALLQECRQEADKAAISSVVKEPKGPEPAKK